MAEINNNIPKFGYNKIDKVEKNNKPVDATQANVSQEASEQHYVQDTGVLGRSQIKNAKGTDVTKSVDDAVKLAEKYPQLLECGDDLFDSLYEQFIADGLEPSDAYAKASIAMEEFSDIAVAHLS